MSSNELAMAEYTRIAEMKSGLGAWRRWGPYLSERQWGTVREDYSAYGNSWEYFPHDHARSRAYRWGEDGLAGFSDDACCICMGVALWNGKDPILKERLFGLTNGQGNHGEDVKEIYYYLDGVPSHAYQKMLYKYPQGRFPYEQLLERNAKAGRRDAEFELIDTGIFNEDKYFDVFVEYAKRGPNEVLMQVAVHNRGPDKAMLTVLPQIWFRNTWSWKPSHRERPILQGMSANQVAVKHHRFADYKWHALGADELLFCENDSNARMGFGNVAGSAFFKDGFHEYVVGGKKEAVNPQKVGTKCGALYRMELGRGESRVVQVWLAPADAGVSQSEFVACMLKRKEEADAYFADIHGELKDEDDRRIQRQALAGMLWSKQFYNLDVRDWLQGDPLQPAPPQERWKGRNAEWKHLNNADIISMPDKWEYPWYASWDLAFHCIPLAMMDAEFAKQQLLLLTREWYMHPNGQLPAYEWAFGDVNPPVHAWAVWRVFQMDRRQQGGNGDLGFLERAFHKLMLNFTWWVNRKDMEGKNVFQGGFLGLDNIGVFDRSKPLPTGGFINQADGTAWMAMYSLNLMRIALELALHNNVYEDVATKFFEHFLHIAEAMTSVEGEMLRLWDDEDAFYYDKLIVPTGQHVTLRVRSLVGLIPLCAVETLEPDMLARLPDFARRLRWILRHRPDLAALVSRWEEPGIGERKLLSLLRGSRMKKLLKRMLDETEFLSEYGVRSLSRQHKDRPYVFSWDHVRTEVGYVPAESDSGMFGGNSNWRGPVWFPINYLLIESLQKFHHYYGNDFKVECPTGSGKYVTIEDAANELGRRLLNIFRRNAAGERPVFGECRKMQEDPHFRDYLLFYEYFHGCNGRGVGASHQTGWTGLAAKLLAPRRPDKLPTE